MIRVRIATLVAALAVCSVVTADADPVTHWNAITVNAATTGRGGPPGLLDIALVHAAVHDAVQAIEGRYERYYYTGTGTGSPAAAVAAAARGVLTRLYPSPSPIHATVETAYTSYITTNGLVGDPGLEVGELAALALYNNHYRANAPTPTLTATTGIGEWQSSAAFGFLHLAFAKPFTLNRIDQFRPPPPPPIGSVAYARAYAEVLAKGDRSAHPSPSVAGTDTDLAWFWSGNFVAQFNETARQLTDAHVTSVGDSARLFALINLAAADAAMAVWDAKYFYNFWRPQTAIRAANDGNPRTNADATWMSLFSGPAFPDQVSGAPPYPDYVSGANGLTGAFTGMLRNFFGTDVMSFTVKTGAANAIDKERDFTSFSQAAQEVVDARILLGIHFRFADEEARRLGERVAHWAFQKYLRPVPGSK
jgi:hypothetical protein